MSVVDRKPLTPEAFIFQSITIREAVAAEYWRKGDSLEVIVYARPENCLLNGNSPLPISSENELTFELIFNGVEASYRGVSTRGHRNLPVFDDFVEGEEVLLIPTISSEETRPLAVPWCPNKKPETVRIYKQLGLWYDDEGYSDPPTASIYCKEQFHYVRKGKSFCGDFLWDIRASSAYGYICN